MKKIVTLSHLWLSIDNRVSYPILSRATYGPGSSSQ
jgi:hypothetical protein